MAVPSALDNRDAELTLNNTISLKVLPRSVRKVAKAILSTDEPMTMRQACESTGVNYDSFRVLLTRFRKKGIDFQQFIDEQSSTILKIDKMAVNRSLVSGAVSGSYNHQKLYYQLTGDLKESNNNINIGSLTIGINIGSLPADSGRDKGIIDVEPFIPGKK